MKNAFGKRVGAAAMVLALITSVAIIGVAHSHTGAKGIVKERMDLMQTLAKSVKAIKGAIIAPSAPTEAGRKTIAASAAIIEEHALRMLKMFPKGSNAHPSEALPSIWTDWPGFEKAARAMAGAAAKLKGAAVTGSRTTLLGDFTGMARTCGACHAQYRLKKRQDVAQ